jgi:urease accessory protein
MSRPIPVCRVVLAAGSWTEEPADITVLDHDQRRRRRIAMRARGGLAFLLDLAETAMLRDGDGLLLDDGRVVQVEAATEDLAAITAQDGAILMRIAWHLGNRHCPTQLVGDRLLIRRDHVVEAMVMELGGTVDHIEAAFDPEGGAYGGHHHRPG